jgi:hypothetical protein
MQATSPAQVRMVGDTRTSRALRLATSPLRPLPDFVIFGAAKCGTTSLYDYLAQHPMVVPCRAKEVHFADRERNAARGPRWYRSWFPTTSQLRKAGRAVGAERAVCGEATPNYLTTPGAAGRLQAVVPDARLIALFREPGDRSWSHYRMFHHERATLEGFAADLPVEAELLAPDVMKLWGDRSHEFLRQSYYAAFLIEWFEAFPREQILVLRSEDLFAQPRETFARVCDHLGLATIEPPAFETANQGAGDQDLSPEVRAWLDDHFAEPNRQLAELTSGDIVWP